ncbi:amidohydrolase family protein [Granulicella tundricola]|uniref:Amidohydrolase n=1 Tax=Granulicella tundricola (strain ATCC BAA-1859 / DSM 23138 / MP5ACTX9) TaxID=1198114 RepID=E8X337_GRATM|nr:amidohydrolase family protein [Granulicella tundricola]ADW69261.1 amidohydrolase [Granulicella tundricola MP5ACTX9]
MRCSVLMLVGVLVAGGGLYGQAAPRVVEHGVYGVHLIERSIGSEEYEISSTGLRRKLSVTTNTSERGMKHTTTTTLEYRADLAPSRFEQHTITPATATAAAVDHASVTEINGDQVTAHEAESTRSFAKPAVAFPGFANMPAAAQMMMMRYWLHHGRPQKLVLMRASADALPVEIRAVGHDVFNIKGAMVRLTRYTVENLVFGREVLWMNDRERLAGVMTFAAGLPQEEVLDEYKSAFDPLFGSAVRQEMLDLATLTRAVKPEASGSYAIVGARLIDATGAVPVENSVVIVRDGRIAAAGAASAVTVPAGMQVIHAEGQSVLPGLWEMHSHYSGVEFGPALLSAGITTARDCGGELLFLIAVRHAIAEEHQLGPRLLLAGLVDGDNHDAFGLFTAGTAEEGKSVVDMYADAHFDQIKVYTQIQPEVLRAISEEAHKRGMTVTGHVPAAVNAFEGVADGMDQINHLQFVTKAMVPEWSAAPFVLNDLKSDRAKRLIALLAAKQIVVDPTIGWGEMAGHPKSIPTWGLEPGVKAAPFPLAWRFNNIGVAGMDEAKFKDGMVAKLQVIGALFQAGVPIVAGSDTNLLGYGLDRELELYVQAGMTPMQAIQSATSVPARVMHHEGDSGTIAVGKRADLVLVMGNPAEKISDLRRVVSVVTEGRIYDSKAMGATVGFHR